MILGAGNDDSSDFEDQTFHGADDPLTPGASIAEESHPSRRGRRTGSEGTQHLQQGYAYAGDRLQDQEAMEEYPLAVAVGFLGVGLLTGLLLPRTRQEDNLLGESSDRLMEQVKDTGKEVGWMAGQQPFFWRGAKTFH